MFHSLASTFCGVEKEIAAAVNRTILAVECMVIFIDEPFILVKKLGAKLPEHSQDLICATAAEAATGQIDQVLRGCLGDTNPASGKRCRARKSLEITVVREAPMSNSL
jgi:hypothetical protein